MKELNSPLIEGKLKKHKKQSFSSTSRSLQNYHAYESRRENDKIWIFSKFKDKVYEMQNNTPMTRKKV